MKISALIFVLMCLLAVSARAEPTLDENFSPWLRQLEQDAIQAGVSPATVHAALDASILDQRVLELDEKQPEKTITFDAYVQRIVTAKRIATGRDFLADNAALLQAISARYGVPPSIIMALWGIESSFGHNSGTYNIVDSLTTLAYSGRRPDFFRAELIDALRILDKEHIPATALRGSWAGAMGQCQFMPSTYLKHAVDYNGDGFPDIWDTPADIFASIANYLAAEGWSPAINWGQEVILTQPVAPDVIGLAVQQDMAQWAQLGLVDVRGNPLPNRGLNASLIQPDGAEGRSFLVTDNFRALMRWNRSTYFATSVGLLADRMQ